MFSRGNFLLWSNSRSAHRNIFLSCLKWSESEPYIWTVSIGSVSSQSCLDRRSSGHIFCFLPIPLTGESLTGLPLHVNAFFSLEDNRRHLKFGTTGDRTDNSALWNDTIIKDFLPEVYLILTNRICDRMIFDPNLNLYKTPLLCTVFQVYRGLLSTIVHPVTFH
jgi:hypothetical protein